MRHLQVYSSECLIWKGLFGRALLLLEKLWLTPNIDLIFATRAALFYFSFQLRINKGGRGA